MARRSMLWRLYPTYLLVILLCAGTVGLYALDSIQGFYYERTAEDLKTRAYLIERQVEDKIGATTREELDEFCGKVGRETATRITIIALDGTVVCDSDADASAMARHDDRPEFKAALESGAGRGIRHSYTLDSNLMYFAVPLERDGEVIGVVRAAIPVDRIDEALYAVYRRIATGGIFVAVAAAGIGYYASKRLSAGMEQMKEGAERFAKGELTHKLASSDTRELGALSDAFNHMAEELNDKIRTIDRQRGTQQAILSSMAEGVLAVDVEEKIISLNAAGVQLLGVSGSAEGRSLQEVARHFELEGLVSQVLSTGGAARGQIEVGSQPGRTLEITGTPLRDPTGARSGAVFVFNDVTQLRRLENVRRDFVANVSHELKTPITAIKGFVETLLEGAVDDAANARRFLEIVSRQVNRLSAIIDDLLALSRIEQEGGAPAADIEDADVREILKAASATCEPKASERQVTIAVECDPAISWRVKAALVEQAVVNLVDNAVKYSAAGGVVRLECTRSGEWLEIAVSDNGCGIERKHLPRLFERFYRADKARSRQLGGTGLGLAIVKHIAQAHGGTVRVESEVGAGSRFTISLPS